MNSQRIDSEELGLKQLSILLWRSKGLVVTCVLVGMVGAGVVAFMQPNVFDAQVVMLPVQSSGAGRLGEMGSQIGGLASLVGLPVGGDSKKAEALGILQSQSLTQRYIQVNGLENVLFDEEASAPKHSLWKAWARFDKLRKINDDKKSGLVSIKITWRDPVLAAKWANDLVQMTNDDMRAKAISESERHIAYLTEQAAKTDIAQVRTATYSILEAEIKNLMLAKGPGDYALKVVDSAIPPERKSGPFRSVWVILGAVAGIMVASMILIAQRSFGDDPAPRLRRD